MVNEPKDIEDILKKTVATAGFSVIPPQIQDVTHRHVLRLSELVVALRAAGVEEEMVRHSTTELLASYEEELLNVLIGIAKDGEQ